jgi:aminoglycoside 6'-N-acetyltransferase I
MTERTLSGSVRVRPVERRDAEAWLRLRQALWPENVAGEHRDEIDRYFAGRSAEPLAVLMAEDGKGRPIGIAELSIRPGAEGCRTDRVAYLEGWYVAPESRRRGVGRVLIEAAEQWARAQGCREFASDTEPSNSVSQAAHEALGFGDAGTIRCFRKDL